MSIRNCGRYIYQICALAHIRVESDIWLARDQIRTRFNDACECTMHKGIAVISTVAAL